VSADQQHCPSGSVIVGSRRRARTGLDMGTEHSPLAAAGLLFPTLMLDIFSQ
jgi:hypothetical protein